MPSISLCDNNKPLIQVEYMDELKKMLVTDPCYEQHIVSIKEIYEEHLFSILIPAIHEGFQSLYKRAIDIEDKFNEAIKRNPIICKS